MRGPCWSMALYMKWDYLRRDICHSNNWYNINMESCSIYLYFMLQKLTKHWTCWFSFINTLVAHKHNHNHEIEKLFSTSNVKEIHTSNKVARRLLFPLFMLLFCHLFLSQGYKKFQTNSCLPHFDTFLHYWQIHQGNGKQLLLQQGVNNIIIIFNIQKWKRSKALETPFN